MAGVARVDLHHLGPLVLGNQIGKDDAPVAIDEFDATAQLVDSDHPVVRVGCVFTLDIVPVAAVNGQTVQAPLHAVSHQAHWAREA